MLLIVTNKKDLATDLLILRLNERKIDFRRLNTEDVGESVKVKLNISNDEADFSINFADGFVLNLEMVDGVYFRQPLPPDLHKYVDAKDLDFANAETLELLKSVWRMIPSSLWLNYPKNIWSATNKIEQLQVASKCGLAIPETQVLSNFDDIKAFVNASNKKLIAKAVRHGFFSRGESHFLAGTQRLRGEIIEFADFAEVPMIVQEEIERGFDIRAVVVGSNVFAAAIFSSSLGENVDWRISDVLGKELKYERVELPEKVSLACINVARSFGLKYSSIDLIQNSNGEIVFLELNPNGQWGWIEEFTGYPIRDAIIDELQKVNQWKK